MEKPVLQKTQYQTEEIVLFAITQVTEAKSKKNTIRHRVEILPVSGNAFCPGTYASEVGALNYARNYASNILQASPEELVDEIELRQALKRQHNEAMSKYWMDGCDDLPIDIRDTLSITSSTCNNLTYLMRHYAHDGYKFYIEGREVAWAREDNLEHNIVHVTFVGNKFPAAKANADAFLEITSEPIPARTRFTIAKDTTYKFAWVWEPPRSSDWQEGGIFRATGYFFSSDNLRSVPISFRKDPETGVASIKINLHNIWIEELGELGTFVDLFNHIRYLQSAWGAIGGMYERS